MIDDYKDVVIDNDAIVNTEPAELPAEPQNIPQGVKPELNPNPGYGEDGETKPAIKTDLVEGARGTPVEENVNQKGIKVEREPVNFTGGLYLEGKQIKLKDVDGHVTIDEIDSTGESAGKAIVSNGSGGAAWQTMLTENAVKGLIEADKDVLTSVNASVIQTEQGYGFYFPKYVAPLCLYDGDNYFYVDYKTDKVYFNDDGGKTECGQVVISNNVVFLDIVQRIGNTLSKCEYILFNGDVNIDGWNVYHAITESGANFTGPITSPSIIENMSGYSYTDMTEVGYTKEYAYVGCSKTGNKVTFVACLKITKTSEAQASNFEIGRFTIPESIGTKLFSVQIGSYSWLDNRILSVFSNSSSFVEVPVRVSKISNSIISLQCASATNMVVDTTYVFRYEITFLLSDNLIGE